MQPFFILVDHRVGDDQEQRVVHPPNRVPAQLAVSNAIFFREVQRIEKHANGCFKADAMFAAVGAILRFVPAESHCVYTILHIRRKINPVFSMFPKP